MKYETKQGTVTVSKYSVIVDNKIYDIVANLYNPDVAYISGIKIVHHLLLLDPTDNTTYSIALYKTTKYKGKQNYDYILDKVNTLEDDCYEDPYTDITDSDLL